MNRQEKLRAKLEHGGYLEILDDGNFLVSPNGLFGRSFVLSAEHLDAYRSWFKANSPLGKELARQSNRNYMYTIYAVAFGLCVGTAVLSISYRDSFPEFLLGALLCLIVVGPVWQARHVRRLTGAFLNAFPEARESNRRAKIKAK